MPTAYTNRFVMQLTDGGSACVSFGAYRGSSKTQFTIYAPKSPASNYGIWWLTMGY